jgi:hypothetical protein
MSCYSNFSFQLTTMYNLANNYPTFELYDRNFSIALNAPLSPHLHHLNLKTRKFNIASHLS